MNEFLVILSEFFKSDFVIIMGKLAGGFLLNCRLWLLTLLLALPLGLLISFGSMSKWKIVSAVTKTIVWVIRGLPLLLLLLIIYFAPGLLNLGTPWGKGSDGRFVAALVAFVINYACYFSEIFRGGIQSVPVGQTEAGQVLGMTKSQIFFKVILLQVIKRIVPPMSNEIITLVKDTTLARLIANKEILMWAGEYAARGLIVPLFSSGIFFLAFVGMLTLLFGWFERKLDYFRV
ncbi:MAG: ABC transporter permease subunit [Chitinispirillales bacterium]|jgi:polar amino acid transport system permease protein|nr:ABC transporter permease subunit [Chitinispirillales bacterium]